MQGFETSEDVWSSVSHKASSLEVLSALTAKGAVATFFFFLSFLSLEGAGAQLALSKTVVTH